MHLTSELAHLASQPLALRADLVETGLALVDPLLERVLGQDRPDTERRIDGRRKWRADEA
jgi:hypothetical protein